MSHLLLDHARAEALFTSDMSVTDEVTFDRVTDAIRRAVRVRHVRGCAAYVAFEFGEHPEIAVQRMRWALEVVAATYHTR